MTREARHLRCPESVLGWIPWYTEGTLSERQKGAVEAHASECADCRAELDMISGAPFEIDVSLPDPDRLFAEISARIDADPTATPDSSTVVPIDRARPLSGDDLERLESWLGDASSEAPEASASAPTRSGFARVISGPWAGSRALAAAAALALLFAGGLGGSLLFPISKGTDSGAVSNASYELAAAAPAVDAGGPALDVVFDAASTAGEISSMLRRLELEIVSGPTDLGVYRLRSRSGSIDGRAAHAAADATAHAAAMAARLKTNEAAIVIFAEAVP